MKHKRIVSMIGALVLIISAVALITGCPRVNDGKDKSNNDNIKDILGVKSTGEAVDSLKV